MNFKKLNFLEDGKEGRKSRPTSQAGNFVWSEPTYTSAGNRHSEKVNFLSKARSVSLERVAEERRRAGGNSGIGKKIGNFFLAIKDKAAKLSAKREKSVLRAEIVAEKKTERETGVFPEPAEKRTEKIEKKEASAPILESEADPAHREPERRKEGKHISLVEKIKKFIGRKKEELAEKLEAETKVSGDKDFSPAGRRGRPGGVNLIKGDEILFFDWTNHLFALASFAAFCCFLVAVGWFAFDFYEKSQSAGDSEFEQLYKEVNLKIVGLEKEAKLAYELKDRIVIAKQILDQHVYWTNFFNFLEKNTLAEVYYGDFNGADDGRYTLSAHAKSFRALVEQIKLMRKNPDVKEVKTTGGSLGSYSSDSRTGGENVASVQDVGFDLELTLNPKVFTRFEK